MHTLQEQLRQGEENDLTQILDSVDFTCDSSFNGIQHDDETIMDKVFVRENIDCGSLVELTY